MTRTTQRETRTASAARAGGGHHPYSAKLLKLLLLLLAGLLLWGLVSQGIAHIPLRQVEVEGLTRYGEAEVLAAAGLSDCKYLTAFDREACTQALTAFYPYISAVRVKYVFPLGLRLVVTEEQPRYFTCIANDYFALSEDLKVLERASGAHRFEEMGLRRITLTGIQSAMLGETLDYGGDYLEQLLREIDESELGARITDVRLGDRYHLSVVCDDAHTLYLGEIVSVDAKLQLAAMMLSDARLPDGCSAILDVSDLKKTSIRYEMPRDGVLEASE